MKIFEALAFVAVAWFFILMTIVVVDEHYAAQVEAVVSLVDKGADVDVAVCIASTPYSNHAIRACVKSYRDSRKVATHGQAL